MRDGTAGRGGSARFARGLGWFLFHAACAAGAVGLAYLAPAAPLSRWVRTPATVTACFLLPLAAPLVPMLEPRRIPWNRRGMAWRLAFLIITGVVLGVTAGQAGHEAGLRERGRWAEAVVVDKETGKIDECTLRRPPGRVISPALKEGEGCRESVAEGDTLYVRYDPEGAAGPAADDGTASYGGLIAGTAALHVVLGTWEARTCRA